VNSSGSYAWSTFGVEVGDEVTVEGPRSTYGTVVELVDATFISVTKSLISVNSVDPEDGNMPLEGGAFAVELACAGDGVTVDIPDDAKDWLSIASIVSANGSVTITFNVARNDGGDRNTTIVFYTTSDSNEYSCQTIITQAGSIMPVSIAEFNAAEVSDTQYRITGYISSVESADNGRFYVADYSGETYIYNMDGFALLGANEGDIITVVGKRNQYGETIEMTDAYAEDITPVTPIDIASFRELSDDSGTYYRLTGTVCQSSEDGTKFDLDIYGNFALADSTGEVYVYGVSTGVGGESGAFGTLGVSDGDELTIICYKTSYGGLVEAGGAMYVAHE
ncbi:MAG: DNA-binding protein, partial [Prevotella sp.]|nr:DNA-binding protein [Prevotella sp.]